MNSQNTTIDALLEEIQGLRTEIDSLRKQGGTTQSVQSSHFMERRHLRESIEASIDFVADFDVLSAKAVDISQGGICFELSSQLPFELLVNQKDGPTNYRAQLVWVRKMPDDTYRYGFEFVQTIEETSF